MTPGRAGATAYFILCVLAASCTGSLAQPQTGGIQPVQNIAIGYIELNNDKRYEPVTLNRRAVIRDRPRPWTGAVMGVDDTQTNLVAAAIRLKLERYSLPDTAGVSSLASRLVSEGRVRFLLADLPAEIFHALAAATKGADILIFNISARDDELRRKLCAPQVAHVMPSQAMLADAMAQYFVARKWRSILVLEGPDPRDGRDTKAFVVAARKFGLRIVAHRNFAAGNDPRQRELNNPALVTASSADYDVIFIADTAFDFARTLQYRAARARPLAGSIGLEPAAWHWLWERNGAPQVNSRHRRLAEGRHMGDAGWAAWMAVRMIADGVSKGGHDFAARRNFILRTGKYDPAKGVAASFRPWDQQLRQPVLLVAPFGAVDSAPMPGFLHKDETLDTLGDDRPDTPCKLDG